jgi:hypothetical protein
MNIRENKLLKILTLVLLGDPNNKLLDTLFDDINQDFGRLPG